MKIKDLSFMQNHSEKVAIGAGAAFALAMVIYTFMSPFSGTLNGKTMPITSMEREVNSHLKKYLDQRQQPAKRVDPADYTVEPLHELLAKVEMYQSATTSVLPAVAGKYPIDPTQYPGEIIKEFVYWLPTVPAPKQDTVKVASGFSVLANGKDVGWVSVSAELDMRSWEQDFSRVPEGEQYSTLNASRVKSALGVARVRLYRQSLLADGSWGDEELIETGSKPAFVNAPNAEEDPEAAKSFIAQLMDQQQYVCMPSPPQLSSNIAFVEPWSKPEDNDFSGSVATIWAYDFSVKPGETYRYRMVADMLNPLYLQGGLEASQKENYTRPMLSMDVASMAENTWKEVVLPVDNYCFYTVSGKRSATFKVRKWSQGKWHEHSFEVSPGDLIGHEVFIGDSLVDMSTGNVLLDMVEGKQGPRGDKQVLVSNAQGDVRVFEIDDEEDRINTLESRGVFSK